MKKLDIETTNTISKAQELLKQGDLKAALQLCKSVLTHIPQQPDCLYLMGNIYNKVRQFAEAKKILLLCLHIHPQKNIILTELAITLRNLKRLEEAEKCINTSFKLDRSYEKTYIQKALLLKLRHQFTEAENVLIQLIDMNHRSISALNNLGNLYIETKRIDQGIEQLEKAISIKPQGLTLKNIALAELQKGDPRKALHYFSEAHKYLPKDFSILFEMGMIHLKNTNFLKALFCFEKVLKLNPKHTLALMNAGAILSLNGDFSKAKLFFEKVLQQNSHHTEALCELAQCKNNLADWKERDIMRDNLIRFLNTDLAANKQIVCSPFNMHYYNIHNELQYRLMQSMSNRYKLIDTNAYSFEKRTHSKIRIGYMSPDFKSHALGMSVYQMFKHHNREEFEVYAFSVYPTDIKDQFNETIRSGVDHYFDLGKLTPKKAAQFIYEQEIDILVDFGGYTRFTKPEILAIKPAPIQILMFGQPDTTAMPQVDYFISDDILIDQVNRKYYTESILYLPYGFICSPIEPSENKIFRQDLGIEKNTFLFCSFCSPYKYNPELFAIWMEILKQVENSVLWLMTNQNPTFEKNIKKEAQKSGIDPARILFAEPLPIHDHLSRMQICDLFLDTQYYSSCSSGSHALMSGLPVLTVKGDTNANRQGASVCRAAGLTETICETLEEYRDKGIGLALAPEKLNLLKRKLTQNKEEIPHFNLPLNVSYIEKGYKSIWHTYKNACKPSDITIEKEPQTK